MFTLDSFRRAVTRHIPDTPKPLERRSSVGGDAGGALYPSLPEDDEGLSTLMSLVETATEGELCG